MRADGCNAQVVAGDLDGLKLQGVLVDAEADLAPDAAVEAAVPAGVALPQLTREFEPRAVDQGVRRAL
jgi:hypothetical protein